MRAKKGTKLKMPKHVVVIDVPMYKLQIAFCRHLKDFESLLHQCGESSEGEYTGSAMKLINPYDGLPYFAAYVDNRSPAGTVAHEAFHCMNQIFEHIGFQIAYNNDEAGAYFLGWLVDKFTEALSMTNKSLEII